MSPPIDPDILLLAVAALAGAALVVNLFVVRSVAGLKRGEAAVDRSLRAGREEAARAARELREEVSGSLVNLSRLQNERLDAVRTTVESRLDALRTENEAKLEQMRKTVDEQLQGTLERRLAEKFGVVSEQLERMHQSVGEMQALAAGVGDLKRVLSNVKARGTWGEVSLGNLLEQVLTAEQFAGNVEIVPGSAARVEFAIRLPGRGGERPVWLPIDAKFPSEDYERLVAAADLGDKAAEEAALKALETRIRKSAQDICEKYVHPPHSTDFALMYLPTEGLYAEVLRRPGLVESMNRECRVVPAGPTTLTAILNSLQMGFRTLAIEQRSSEVWQLLGAVKTEFARYGEALDKVQKRLRQAEGDIEAVRRRERAIDRKLRSVERLPETESVALLDIEQAADEEPGRRLESEAEG